MNNAEFVLNAITADWQSRADINAKAQPGLSGGKAAFSVSLLSLHRKGLIDVGYRHLKTGEVTVAQPSRGRPPAESERVYRLAA